MAKPLLALDMDGVIADSFTPMLEFFNKFFGVDIAHEEWTDYNAATVYQKTTDEMNVARQALEKTGWLIDSKPLEHSLKTIGEISKNFDLIIITSRVDSMKDRTRDWAAKHLGGIDIHFSHGINSALAGGPGRRTKCEIALDLGAVCLIEDNPHEFDENWPYDKILPILIAQPWNQDAIHVARLTWPEVPEYLRKNLNHR